MQQSHWNINFVSTPRKDKSTGTINYLSGIFRRLWEKSQSEPLVQWDEIGQVTYSNGAVSQLQVPVQVMQQYSLNINNMQAMSGLHISSHRPIYSYQPVESIPTQAMSREQLYNLYFSSFYQRYMGGYNAKSPGNVMKESLISLALFGMGNQYVTPDDKARAAFEGFQEVLRKVLPPKIGFRQLSIRVPEVVFETDSGEFSIDAVSGGVASILDMAWRIFTYSPEGGRFVCTIDEPENHLHPELQQSFLPNLVSAFPNVQFIIATHNPFMITAVYDSFVYVLDYNEARRVESKRLEAVNKAGTANEILRNVLGLPFTMPLWAETKLEAILNKYAQQGLSEENILELEAELASAGLEGVLPDQELTYPSEEVQP